MIRCSTAYRRPRTPEWLGEVGIAPQLYPDRPGTGMYPQWIQCCHGADWHSTIYRISGGKSRTCHLGISRQKTLNQQLLPEVNYEQNYERILHVGHYTLQTIFRVTVTQCIIKYIVKSFYTVSHIQVGVTWGSFHGMHPTSEANSECTCLF